jgi:hypothetical protein
MERPTEKENLVLVFDLDDTLFSTEFMNTWDLYRESPDLTQLYSDAKEAGVTMNAATISLLINALNMKRQGSKKIDAILLLTNNASLEYVNFVEEVIRQIYNEVFPEDTLNKGTPMFDLKYTSDRKDPLLLKRRKARHNARKNIVLYVKTLEDVNYMLIQLGKSTENSVARVYFFDDQSYHRLASQLPEGQFKQISSMDETSEKYHYLLNSSPSDFVLEIPNTNQEQKQAQRKQAGGSRRKKLRQRRTRKKLTKPATVKQVLPKSK